MGGAARRRPSRRRDRGPASTSSTAPGRRTPTSWRPRPRGRPIAPCSWPTSRTPDEDAASASWESAASEGLTFSVLLRPSRSRRAVGVGAADRRAGARRGDGGLPARGRRRAGAGRAEVAERPAARPGQRKGAGHPLRGGRRRGRRARRSSSASGSTSPRPRPSSPRAAPRCSRRACAARARRARRRPRHPRLARRRLAGRPR